MRKALFTLLILCTAVMAMAQEETEFKMIVGDTLVWKPFDDCHMLGYNISGPKVVSFKPLHYGEKIEIIAKQAGNSSIIATCSDNDTKAVASFTVSEPYVAPVVADKPEKPETQAFTASYNFNPPTDHYFITIANEASRFNETYMKLGDNEAYNDGQGVDRFWNLKTGKNWYYRPDAQGWTDDVDWEFEPLGESFFPLNAFASEVNKDNLSQYYVGTEKVLDIDCWHFFVDFEDGTVIQYWVDPANGCTLKRQVNTEAPRVVTVYDLKYTRLYFGPSFKKSLHDTTR
ncbi:MAG: hypothetical protein IJ622_00375 [Bacteroidales bacterium]|nr:hypothetical protein [Bacteroidales bacterium]